MSYKIPAPVLFAPNPQLLHDQRLDPLLLLPALESFTQHAIKAVLSLSAAGLPEPSVLTSLSEIEISLISDEEIAQVHAEFMDDPDPTDVITFHHGEILISVETAARYAPAHSNSLERELRTYILHGLLHLHGYSDTSEPSATQMHRVQEELLLALESADA